MYILRRCYGPCYKKYRLLIAISGLGETKVVTMAVKEIKAKVVGITTNTKSTLSNHLNVDC